MDLLDMNDPRFSRNVSEASRMCSLEQKKIASDLNNACTNAISSEVPIKLLIAQEMSKEVNFQGGQPNLVAKLMGLDVMPRVDPDSSVQRMSSKSHHSQNRFVNRADQNAFKDVPETKRQSWNSPYRRCSEESEEDPMMALVRKKFSEAKRLSTDGSRQSKQFQDALEVLSSNKDLFLKCIQECTSVSSEHLEDRCSVPPPDKRRITVLLPSQNLANHSRPVAASKDGNHMKKGTIFGRKSSEITHLEPSSCFTGWEHCEDKTQPTRIVVLKPGPANLSGDKLNVSPQYEKSWQLYEKLLYGNMENAQSHEPKEYAQVTRDHELSNLERFCREETSIPSGPYNGYIGDDSSFFPDANPRHTENMSPLSRHTWDYANRIGSPFSSPSYSQISYSPDYLVCHEAKKRLSERWATMADDGTCDERILSRGSSKSLGEMLALSEARKSGAPNPKEGNTCVEKKDSKPQLVRRTKWEQDPDELPRNLIRSRSLPVFSPEFGTRMNLGMEEAKTGSVKLSFKGMLSSLFSSRHRGSGLEKANIKYENFTLSNELGSKTVAASLKPPHKVSQRSSSQLFHTQSGNMMHPPMYGGHADHQNQPSTISVLVPHFVDECMARGHPQYLKPNQRGAKLSPNSCESNLLGKSPAIGTVPRTISSDDLYADTASSHPATCRFATRESSIEPDWMMFAKVLLSVSGMQDKVLSSFDTESWHSLESPLDPSLRERYVDLTDKEMLYEDNRRRKTWKLVYDCVNAALMQITTTWLDHSSQDKTEQHFKIENGKSLLGDKVLALINSWFCDVDNDENDDGMAMEMVKDEVVGWWWKNQFKVEMNDVNKSIAGTLLEDLMHEIVVVLVDRIN